MADLLPPNTRHQPPSLNRNPSRSEKLLLDTLRRHDRESERPLPHGPLPISPSPTPQRNHKRSHSHVPFTTTKRTATSNAYSSRSPSPSDDDVEEVNDEYYAHAAFLFRSAITGSPAPPSPTTSTRRSSRRREHHKQSTVYGGDAEFHRSVSPSPPSRPTLHRAAQTEMAHTPLTPHEQVLRARLERVLQSQATHGHHQHSPDTRHAKRSSLGSSSPEIPTSATRSGESSVPRTPSHVRSRSKTDPSYPSSPLPLDKHKYQLSAPPSEMLTPPPTPPATSRIPALPRTPSSPRVQEQSFFHQQQQLQSYSNGKYHHHPSSPPPTPFNAHAASRHCRSIEGYVSFAAVEGLGAPDDLDALEDLGDAQKPAQESRMMRGLGGLFRAWS